MDTSALLTILKKNDFLRTEFIETFLMEVGAQIELVARDDADELFEYLIKISKTHDGQQFLGFLLGTPDWQTWLEDVTLVEEYGEDY